MEALLEKEGDVESWNDERLDEMSRRMDDGFKGAATKMELAATREEMRRGFDNADRNFGKIEQEFGRVTDRLDKLFYIQLFFLVSLAASLLTDQA